jgi:Fur family ferric uptake transcriptional regulator
MTKARNVLKNFVDHPAKHGLKSSDKRYFIIDYFVKQDRHFTVEELHDEIKKINPEISYSTVYRALKLLTQCGLASECTFDTSVVRYEPVHQARHHDHLICRRCGKIIEFENARIEQLQNGVARKYSFLVSSHKLELYGVCRTCQQSKKRS